MIIEIFLSLFAIFALLVITEFLWRTKRLHVETSRKMVHIGTGVFTAFWPYFLSWPIIQLLSILMLVVILASYHLHIFKSIHSIDRLTIGELLYPIGIGLCALLEPSPWLFTVAILHLTLADGLAALVGVRHGKSTQYSLLGHKKSLVGSGVFFVTSLSILFGAALFLPETHLDGQYFWLAGIALAVTAIENISWYGLDDISVPIGVIVLLSLLP